MGEKKRKEASGVVQVPVSRDKPIAVHIQAYESPEHPGQSEIMLRLGGYRDRLNTELAAQKLIGFVEEEFGSVRVGKAPMN